MSEEEMQDEGLAGKTLGQYEIQEEIGRGGMASVYSAKQKSMGRTVAVKVLPRNLMHDPSFFERFEREVDVISTLEHPHILPIYDYGQSGGIPYIAMRYLGGGSLEQRLERGVLPPEELEKPMRQVGQALDYAHQQGIIHRDLKPGNIMLDEGGNAYLSDFGIARVLGSNLTGSMIVGTPAYMSPEQAHGMPVDGRADIYSLGVMLFHLLTGQRPFQAETPMAVLLKHINEPMPSTNIYREDISPAIDSVIARATSKDANNRYSSASEMCDAYSAALRGIEEDLSPTVPARQMEDAPTIAAALQTPIPSAPSGTPLPTEGVKVVATNQLLSATDQIHKPSRWSSMRKLLIAIVILVIGGGGVLGVMMSLNQDGEGIKVIIPRPFPNAETVREDLFTISMPRNWTQTPSSGDVAEDRTVRVWHSNDNEILMLITLIANDLRQDSDFFRYAAEEYSDDYYEYSTQLEMIDEVVAENGSIRRSYWVSPSSEEDGGEQLPVILQQLDEIKLGQVDAFFIHHSSYLVVVEIFTSDINGNEELDTLQHILDSLRITAGADEVEDEV